MKKFRRPISRFVSAGVDADVRDAETQQGQHRFPRQGGNFFKVTGIDKIGGGHPRTAAGEDFIKGDVPGDITRGDAAGGYILQTGIGGGNSLDVLKAPGLFRRKKFYHIKSEFQRLLNIRRIGAAGGNGDSLLQTVRHHFWIQTGADNKLRPRVNGAVNLIGGQYRSRPDQNFGRFGGYAPDGLFALSRPESNFHAGDTSRRQRFCQRDSLFRIVNFYHRHNADLTYFFQNSVHGLRVHEFACLCKPLR